MLSAGWRSCRPQGMAGRASVRSSTCQPGNPSSLRAKETTILTAANWRPRLSTGPAGRCQHRSSALGEAHGCLWHRKPRPPPCRLPWPWRSWQRLQVLSGCCLHGLPTPSRGSSSPRQQLAARPGPRPPLQPPRPRLWTFLAPGCERFRLPLPPATRSRASRAAALARSGIMARASCASTWRGAGSTCGARRRTCRPGSRRSRAGSSFAGTGADSTRGRR
mmetsp:Transcript_79151/g.223810  ORF Transcript_79151/g.223810 Transcript_79151/m.223810 type:complete len:220 (+) Transcript_79151:1993-2652(+)